MPRGWGGVARRGARVVTSAPSVGAQREATRATGPRQEWEPEVWVEEPAAVEERPVAARRTARQRKLPEEVAAEVSASVGAARSGRMERRLADATEAYDRDRYQEALRLLRPLAQAVPTAPAVRELHGLTLYRLGRWSAAVRELEAFHALSGSFDQHPVLADCYRGLKRWAAVDATWEALRRSSPSQEVLTEGRIVMAGALADRADLRGAIELLEQASSRVKRPRLHHLRLRYALADLYERVGEVPRARELFRSVVDADPGFVDAAARLRALA